MLTKHLSEFHKHEGSVWSLINTAPFNRRKQRRPNHYALCSFASSVPPLKLRQCLVYTRSDINQTSEH